MTTQIPAVIPLPDLPTVSPVDASLLFARVGSTDGKVTMAALREAMNGPEVAACIGYQSDGGTPFRVTISTIDVWEPVTPTTGAAIVTGGTHDGSGGFEVGVVGPRAGGATRIRLSYRVVVKAVTGTPNMEATILLDGVAQVGPRSGERSPAGAGTSVLLSGECIRDVADEEVVQIGLRNRTNTTDIDVMSLSLTLHRLTP
jgi:hypothetical protein